MAAVIETKPSPKLRRDWRICSQRKAIDCAYCRHSGTEIASGQFVTNCRKELPMDAQNCAEFRDSRDPVPNHHLPFDWKPE